jgi:hypothetical protein
MAGIGRDALRAWDEEQAQAGVWDPDPPAIAAQRRAVRRWNLEADALTKAAAELPSCGRNWVAFTCPGGHVHHVRRRCGLATLCPDCARAESARLAALYAVRVRALLARSPGGVRARLVTLALRPRAAETLPDAFERCRLHGKRVLRVLWGIPVDRLDWQLYRRVFPLVPRELAAVDGRERRAWTARRRRVEADARRRLSGWLIASEFGERGMKAHVHALVVGRWIPQHRIAEAWRLVTGDSAIVDVRLARDVKEVTKYAVKFFGRAPAELASLYRATCGRRRIEAVGQLRKPIEGEVRDRAPIACPTCGEPLKAIGLIPAALWAIGVREPLEQHRFRARAGP